MAVFSKKTFLDAITLIDKYDENLAESIVNNEKEVDEYEDATSSYLLQISEQDLSQKDSREVSQLLHVVGDVERLRTGNCTIELGFVLSDILANFKRVSDHCSNIAVCLLEIENNSLQTHEYLHKVKETGANEFFEFYDMYKQRYNLERFLQTHISHWLMCV